MQLDYITINGLDEATKERMEADIASSGYRGSKSGYCVLLINEALDYREKLRAITDKAEAEKLFDTIKEEGKAIQAIRDRQCRDGIETEINRDLIAQTYQLLVMIADFWNIDHSEIDKGEMTRLPKNLFDKEGRLLDAYDGK